jgi:hypothetical protein
VPVLRGSTPASRERRGEACTHPSRAHIGNSDGQIDASTGRGTASDCLRGAHPRRIGTGQQLSPGSLHGSRRGFSFATLPPTKDEPRPRARIRGPAAPAGALAPACGRPGRRAHGSSQWLARGSPSRDSSLRGAETGADICAQEAATVSSRSRDLASGDRGVGPTY